MVLDFRINGAPMGSESAASEGVNLTVRVWGTKPLERLTITRGLVGADPSDVAAIHTIHLSGRYAEVTWRDDPPSGVAFYYVVAKQRGEDIPYPRNVSMAEGCRAWSSPIWVARA
jgi:hypothetical protein